MHAPYVKADIAIDFQARVGDLKGGQVIEVQCFHCAHTGTISAQVLRERFPEHERLTFVKKKLKCAKCGNRDNNSWTVYQMPRGE
jgi:predicted nucleic-acid-binding Zn-ribbon protein